MTLSGSFQTTPDLLSESRVNGVNYSVVTQSPEFRMDTLEDLRNIPITAAAGGHSDDSGRH